jgi:FKBP-type peptidyl-prolyl cis-trans isomerase
MAKRTSKKVSSPEHKKEDPAIKKVTPAKAKKEGIKKPLPKKESTAEAKIKIAATKKATPLAVKKRIEKKLVSKKTASAEAKEEKLNNSAIRKSSSVNANKPTLRSVYSNSKYTLMVLGFGSDFNTKKTVVIFSDLLTAQVHTIALSSWNRWKLKEVKKINTET